jgi:photosystem II stability/assembly factor-like uncharacterized protein
MLLALVVVVLVALVVTIAVVAGGSNKGAKATPTTLAHAPAGSTASPNESTPSHPVVVAGTASNPWVAQTVPPNAASYLYDITCSTSKACVAVGKTGSCPQQGVMCNSGGYAVILATTDGGQTWETRSYPSNSSLFSNGYLFSVSCGSSTVCLAGGSGSQMVLLSSHDGGATWVSDSYPPELANGHIFQVYCKTASDCWALGGTSTSFILATTDGGQSWTQQHVPSGLGINAVGLLTIGCVTTSNCVLAADAGGSLLILGTHDGGSSWSVRPYPSTIATKSSDIGFTSCSTKGSCYISGSTSSASGGPPVVVASHDSGSTWETVRFPSSLGLTSVNWIRCADGSHCWALVSGTSGPMMLASSDGGSSWAVQSIPSNVGLANRGLVGLACPDTSTCWAVGDNAANTAPVILAARP